MGLFSFLKDAAIEANEDAHGARLLSTVQSIIVEMERLDPKPQFVVMAGYLQIRERLQNIVGDHSKDERIKMGRIMQDQAREQFKFDITGGYAKLLAGAWFESQERNSLKAQQAYSLLNAFTDHARRAIEETKVNSTISLAQRGDADAQGDLSMRYFRGDGVTADHDEALRWARLAAEQGNSTGVMIRRVLEESDEREKQIRGIKTAWAECGLKLSIDNFIRAGRTGNQQEIKKWFTQFRTEAKKIAKSEGVRPESIERWAYANVGEQQAVIYRQMVAKLSVEDGPLEGMET